MKILLVSLAIVLSACGSPDPDVPTITPVTATTSALTDLQKDVEQSARSLTGTFKFNMSTLADSSQSDSLITTVSLICENLKQQTPESEIETALISVYGDQGAKDLIKLSIKHQCTEQK